MAHDNNEDDDDERSEHPEGWSESIGAPKNFWSNIEQSNEVDNRFPEKHSKSKSRPNQSTESAKMPIKKLGALLIPSSHLQEYGITREEAAFMKAVVKAMNGELQGYNLTESMYEIKRQYEIDEDKLIDGGYLKRHTGSDRRAYYTVTFDGQEACRLEKKQGRRYGDIGSDTPHRVGMELAQRYYESFPEVRRVEVAVREDGKKTDLLVVNKDHTRRAIIEVEGGRVEADPNVSEDDRTGITNYASVRSDYRMLAASAGESVWVVRNYELAGDVLQALSSGDDIPFELRNDVIQSVKDVNMRIRDLNEDHIAPLQDDGIDEVVTFRQLRNRLNEKDCLP